MPDVQGMGLKDALYLLEQQGLQVSVRGKGSVSGQSVPAGTPVGTGDTLTIRLEPKIRVVKADTKTKA
jgi:cell division protein FtsI (penicillin-binding protein 3)